MFIENLWILKLNLNVNARLCYILINDNENFDFEFCFVLDTWNLLTVKLNLNEILYADPC